MTKTDKAIQWFIIGSFGYFLGRLCEAIAVGNI